MRPLKSWEEHSCQKCGAVIDAPIVTGLLCSEHWLHRLDEKAVPDNIRWPKLKEVKR